MGFSLSRARIRQLHPDRQQVEFVWVSMPIPVVFADAGTATASDPK